MNSKPIDWSQWGVKEIPRIKKERGNCRTCKHGEYWHLRDNPACNYNTSNEVRAVDPRGIHIEILIPREITSSICACLEYIPSDNLAYLEYLYDKSENKK